MDKEAAERLNAASRQGLSRDMVDGTGRALAAEVGSGDGYGGDAALGSGALGKSRFWTTAVLPWWCRVHSRLFDEFLSCSLLLCVRRCCVFPTALCSIFTKSWTRWFRQQRCVKGNARGSQ